MTYPPKDKPVAIVLCKTVTGLATVRSLGRAGVEVHALIFAADDPVRFSRYCRNIHLHGMEKNATVLRDFLIQYSEKLGNRPVVFPTSDALALFLARNFEALNPVCRIWTTKHADLLNIISKDRLYRTAAIAGVRTVPFIITTDPNEISEWSDANRGPYLIKPLYTGIATSTLGLTKNLTIPTREMLLNYVAEHGTASVIIQRVIRGGDGYSFDCYGLCDHNGRVLTLASRRRLRQNRPDFGTSTHSEIPADSSSEASIFRDTVRLLDSVKYHGMFDIEWLFERDTGKFYLIDFIARPAVGIGGLTDSGLNLAALAYSELIDNLPSHIEMTPSLKHMYWVDLLRDIESFRTKRKDREINLIEWLVSILRCRSFAYRDWRDPGPGIVRALTIACRVLHFALITKSTDPVEAAAVTRRVTPLAPMRQVPYWWDSLYEASGDRSIFLSAAWLQSWLQIYGDDFEGYWVHWETNGAVVGGCLITARKHQWPFAHLRTLYLNATGQTKERSPLAEFNDVLHISGFEAAIAVDFSRFLKELPWSRMLISGYEDHGLISHLISLLPTILVERELKPAPFVELAATSHESYEAMLGSNTRGQIGRSHRIYEQRFGPITLKVASSLDEALQYLDALGRQSNFRWRSKGEIGSFASQSFVDFHRRLIAYLWPAQAVDIVCVRAGETIVGYLYNLIDRGKVYFYQSGLVYGTDARLKPGLLTHVLAIEHYRKRGLREYDFLGGDARYKRSLAKQHRNLYWTTIYRDRPLMRLMLWVRKVKHVAISLAKG